METILLLTGLILVVEGMPYFAFPSLVKKWIAQVLELSDALLRVLGLVAMLFGLFLVYLARRIL
jgi:uncharacterized protein YjeT (DUF2065 family)